MDKNILLCSNGTTQRTGFGKFGKEILSNLYSQGYTVTELACGVKDGSNELKSRPWKARGTIPANDQDLAPYVQNQGMMERIFFGDMMIDRVIAEEKITHVLLMEDIWRIAWGFTKPWFNKIPTAIITPIDSLPLLRIFKDNKPKLKHLFVKSPFAQKALKEIGIEAEILTGLVPHQNFFPLPKNQKGELKKFYGLEDTFVIGKVFRNQLRKLAPTLLREFKAFKDKHPDVKAKLLFHTHFNDSEMSWDIDTKRQEYGLEREDLLCTYVCKNCKVVGVLPFNGQGIACHRCNTPDGLSNPSIALGITDEELNGIYNLMDMYCLAATSGGLELTMIEAMLAGLPTATCPYSFGEQFTDSGLTLPIEFEFYEEVTSGFRKSQPITGSIVKVIEEVYFNQKKYKEIGLKSREWALKTFDRETNFKKIVNFIESTENTFDYDFTDLKDVDYPPNYSLENAEFVIDLYKGVFGHEIEKDNPDVKKYVERLNYDNKESVVREIKQIAAQHNQAQNQAKLEDFIIKNDNKKLAYVIGGGPEECFMSLSILEGLHNKYPDWDIYIACHPANMVIFDHLTWVKNLLPFHQGMYDPKALEGVGDWPGVVNFCLIPELATQNFAYVRNLNC